jgi:hypothetical protein
MASFNVDPKNPSQQLWEVSPSWFLAAQKAMIIIKITEWEKTDGHLSMSVFLEKYLDWLNPEVPRNFIAPIVKMAIEIYESRAAQKISNVVHA